MKKWILFVLLAGIVSLPACSKQEQSDKTSDKSKIKNTLVEGIKIKEIGIGDGHLSLLNTIVLDPEAGINARILQTTHTLDEGILARYQPSTGKTEYLSLPGASGAWAATRKGEDVYIGSHQPGILYHMNINDNKVTPIEVPKGEGDQFYFIWTNDFGSDGNVYFGTYPECKLIQYNPADKVFKDCGVMVKGEQYLRGLCAEFPGKVFCGVGSHAHLVEYDIKTGKTAEFLPEKYKNESFAYNVFRFKDLLAAYISPSSAIVFFNPDSHEFLREIIPPEGEEGFWKYFYAADDYLYFATMSYDNLYRYDYENNKFTLMEEGLGAPFGMTKDRYLYCISTFGKYSVYDIKEKKVVAQSQSSFQGKGMDIFALGEGPDNILYGGAYINQSLFKYNMKTDELATLGRSVAFGGQIRNILSFKDKVYIAHYTHARLTVYDPGQTWNPGPRETNNPRLIGAVGSEQNRFRSIYLAEDKHIYMGTVPDYGKYGGALVDFDPESETFKVYRNVVKDQSVYGIEGDGSGLLIGSTATHGGLGSVPVAKEAKLFVWDVAKKQKVRELVPVAGADDIWSICRTPDGKIIGGADSTLFVYDVAKNEVINSRTLNTAQITKLMWSSDGWGYGDSWDTLFRFSKDLKTVEPILKRAENTHSAHILMETKDGRIFFGIGAVLCELVRE